MIELTCVSALSGAFLSVLRLSCFLNLAVKYSILSEDSPYLSTSSFSLITRKTLGCLFCIKIVPAAILLETEISWEIFGEVDTAFFRFEIIVHSENNIKKFLGLLRKTRQVVEYQGVLTNPQPVSLFW